MCYVLMLKKFQSKILILSQFGVKRNIEHFSLGNILLCIMLLWRFSLYSLCHVPMQRNVLRNRMMRTYYFLSQNCLLNLMLLVRSSLFNLHIAVISLQCHMTNGILVPSRQCKCDEVQKLFRGLLLYTSIFYFPCFLSL